MSVQNFVSIHDFLKKNITFFGPRETHGRPYMREEKRGEENGKGAKRISGD